MSATPKVNAVFMIPGEPATQEADEFNARTLYDAVGGESEIVPLGDSGAVMHINAYGKSKGLPLNGAASRLVDHYRPGFLALDVILGPALITGFDEEGRASDVPGDVARVALTI